MSKTAGDCDNCTKVWFFLKGYYDEHGFAPSYRQIGDQVGLVSTSSVAVHIKHLEAAGIVNVTGRGAIPTEEPDVQT